MGFALLLLFSLALFGLAFSFGPDAGTEDGGEDSDTDTGDDTGTDPDPEPLQPVQDFLADFAAGTAAGGAQGYSEDTSDPVTGGDGPDALFLGGAGSTADGGAGDDLIVLGSGSGGAIYTGDTASAPITPETPTETDPATATGGAGQDIFAINIDTLRDGQFFEITDFNEAEDTLLLTNASEHAAPDSFVVTSIEAQPAEDGSYTDVLLHTDSGDGDTLTTIRLMGVSDYTPENLLFSDRVNMPIGAAGAVTGAPFTISTPMRIATAGAGTATIDLTASDDAFVGTGAGDDAISGSAGTAGAPATLSIHTGAGNDAVDIRNAAGSLDAGAGDDTLEFDGAMGTVDPGDGADTMVLHLQADDPAGPTVITLNDPADSLHFDIADDVPGSIHTELEQVGDTQFGTTHGGSLYLNVYLTDTADPDTSALTPIARLYLGEYTGGYESDPEPLYLSGNANPDLTYNRPVLSGWQPGDPITV